MSYQAICVSNNIINPRMYRPEVGTPYTLTPCTVHPGNVDVAQLPINKDGIICSYAAKYFAMISDATDEEIQEEYQEQEAASLDREFAKIVHEYENA